MHGDPSENVNKASKVGIVVTKLEETNQNLEMPKKRINL